MTKATDLPSWAWANPEDVAARLESMSCDKCRFNVPVYSIPCCVKHRGRMGEKMYRCNDYSVEVKK